MVREKACIFWGEMIRSLSKVRGLHRKGKNRVDVHEIINADESFNFYTW